MTDSNHSIAITGALLVFCSFLPMQSWPSCLNQIPFFGPWKPTRACPTLISRSNTSGHPNYPESRCCCTVDQPTARLADPRLNWLNPQCVSQNESYQWDHLIVSANLPSLNLTQVNLTVRSSLSWLSLSTGSSSISNESKTSDGILIASSQPTISKAAIETCGAWTPLSSGCPNCRFTALMRVTSRFT